MAERFLQQQCFNEDLFCWRTSVTISGQRQHCTSVTIKARILHRTRVTITAQRLHCTSVTISAQRLHRTSADVSGQELHQHTHTEEAHCENRGRTLEIHGRGARASSLIPDKGVSYNAFMLSNGKPCWQWTGSQSSPNTLVLDEANMIVDKV